MRKNFKVAYYDFLRVAEVKIILMISSWYYQYDFLQVFTKHFAKTKKVYKLLTKPDA